MPRRRQFGRPNLGVGLAEGRDDLGHLEAEGTVGIGQGGAVALGIAFVSFGGVCPYLDALACEGRAIARAAHGARHPEAAAADAVDDGRAGAVVVAVIV